MCRWIRAQTDIRLAVTTDPPHKAQHLALVVRLPPEPLHLGVVARKGGEEICRRPRLKSFRNEALDCDVAELER